MRATEIGSVALMVLASPGSLLASNQPEIESSMKKILPCTKAEVPEIRTSRAIHDNQASVSQLL
jgi:hypothetical protein